MTLNCATMPQIQSKRLPSCDACRQRKIKCDRPHGHGLTAADLLGDVKGAPACTPCAELGIACTYVYRRQRRGPPSQFLKRLGQNGTPYPKLETIGAVAIDEDPNPSPVSAGSFPFSPSGSSETLQDTVIQPYAVRRDPNWVYGRLMTSSGPRRQSMPVISSRVPMMPSYPAVQHVQPPPPQTPIEAPQAVDHGLLEDLMGRDTAIYILSLFFDYVHPLIPCIHQPTFMAQVKSRLEQRSTIFYSLLMSILASTLAQVPKALVPVEDRLVGRLAEECHRKSRAMSMELYDPPTVELAIIRFLDGVFYLVNGKPGANAASVGESQQIAITLGLHQEETYDGLDPVETETRRRIFSLIFNADKAMACLRGRPICLRSEECTVDLPRDLDDQYITREGYLEPPAGSTSIISGFNVGTRIFTVLGDIMTLHREARRLAPMSTEMILSRLRDVADLTNRVLSITRDLPPGLKLKKSFLSSSGAPADGWDSQALVQLEQYFKDVGNCRDLAKNGFLVSQGNIYVTHALARFVLLQYRDELLAQIGEPGSTARVATERVLSYAGEPADSRKAVYTDLQDALQNIPIQSLAVNGASLVRKVRYVAVTLLDPAADEDAAKSHSYLLDYLTILSEIEKNLASQHNEPC